MTRPAGVPPSAVVCFALAPTDEEENARLAYTNTLVTYTEALYVIAIISLPSWSPAPYRPAAYIAGMIEQSF